jgi:hypothetical protein
MIRRLSLTIFVSFAFLCPVLAGDFSDGWRCGWEAGWKQIKGHYSFAPYAPYAPYPPLGCDSYRDGYTAGVLAGAEAAEEQ